MPKMQKDYSLTGQNSFATTAAHPSRLRSSIAGRTGFIRKGLDYRRQTGLLPSEERSDVYKKIREYEATQAHQKEHGELFSSPPKKREQIAVTSWEFLLFIVEIVRLFRQRVH